jgi:hypothetical protein
LRRKLPKDVEHRKTPARVVSGGKKMKMTSRFAILSALLIGLSSAAYADSVALNSSGCSVLPCTGGALQYLGSAPLNNYAPPSALIAPTSPTTVPPNALGFITYSVNPAISGNSVWLTAIPGSSWVSFETTGASYTPNPSIPNDFYYYQTTFSATGGTYSGFVNVMADDTAEVLLNGQVIMPFGTVGSDGKCADGEPTCTYVDAIWLNNYQLNAGKNTLTIINAQTGLSAEGVDLSANLTKTPEPSSLLLLGSGLLGLAMLVFWKAKANRLALHS